MKRNFDAVLLDLDNQPFSDNATLKSICIAGLVTPTPDDNQQPATEKVRLFTLAQKIHAGGVIDVTAEEIADLKARIGKNFHTLVVGRAFQMLDADYVEPPAA